MPTETIKVREAIPSFITFEAAIDLATRLAPDRHLPEETYNEISDAIPLEMHMKFGLVLMERGITVDLSPAPPAAEDPSEDASQDVDDQRECPQGIIAYTQKPKGMNPLEDMAYEILRNNHRGKEKSIKVRDLERECGLPPSDDSNRQTRIRGVVHDLIFKHRVPIGSSNPEGYYMVRTTKELDEACWHLLKPAISMFRRVAILKGVTLHILIKQTIMAELENKKLNDGIDQ